MKFNKLENNPNFSKIQEEILENWDKNSTFKKSLQNKDKGYVSFFDGPPFPTGKPHHGTVLVSFIKDMIARYKTMNGYSVPRVWGWDCHGLPVETQVEKILEINDKKEIESKIGIDKFNDECKNVVSTNNDSWREYVKEMCRWVDYDNAYKTMNVDFMESVLWAFKESYNKGLIYQDYRVTPYCYRCETALSISDTRESDSTRPRQDTWCIAKFKTEEVINNKNVYLLAWTTTPWTLFSNMALAVNENFDYAYVEVENEVYVLGNVILNKYDKILGNNPNIIKICKGSELVGKVYEPLTSYFEDKKDEGAFKVIKADFVELDEGVGIVHIAPAFGEDDANVGRNYNLPFVQFVNGKGEMTEETPYAGMFVKDADKPILMDLEKEGLLFDAPKFEHDYPFCWRCDTPLIYYARDTWFIKMSAVKDRLVANNNTVNWIPEGIGKGRFGAWLENVQDWGLSRNRYWGTPLNIWECSCGKRHAIGSKEELKAMSKNCPDDIELHRPYIDEVTLVCPDCGGEMKRVPEVIDCWFDSGAMPFAQWHYPFENQDIFEENFPADFISEAVDQTRGWFYSLMAISTLIFDKAPYKNVIVLGHVLDKDGNKMSKSKGNAVDPMEALNSYGADAIRWYFYSNSAPWLPNRFHEDAVVEGQRKFMGTLWNTYAFYVLYAEIDQFDPTKYSLEYDKLSVMDKWLLSKMNTMVKTVDESLGSYKIPEATRALSEFVDDMSNWYVRRSRDRFWAKGMEQDKINAYMTLYTALVTLCKAAAPMIPFMTEDIYQNLVTNLDSNAPKSIHLCDFPVADESVIDTELEADMDEVLKIVVLGRAARNAANIKNRQPIGNMYVKAAKALSEYFVEIIEDELNVKAVTFKDDVSEFASYSFKPQLKTVGPKYGKQLGGIKQYLANVDGKDAMETLKSEGALKFNVGDVEVSLAEEDLLIDLAENPNYETAADAVVTVVLDKQLTPELIEEGFVREIISKVQTMRKEAGFEVMDKITISVANNDKVAEIMKNNEDAIFKDVLATAITYGEAQGYTKNWNINGEKVDLGVTKNA